MFNFIRNAYIWNLPPAFVHTKFDLIHPLWPEAFQRLQKKIFVGNMRILTYKPKKAYEIIIFNFEILLPLRLLVPVGYYQNKD